MSKLADFDGILLDFDGTLVDSEPLHYQANNYAFQKIGHTIDPTEYYLHWSHLGEGPVGEITRYDLANADAAFLKASAKERFSELILSEPIPIMLGAAEVFSKLQSEQIISAIASNTPVEFIRTMIHRAGLNVYQSPIIGGDNGLRGKPHPDIVLKAMIRLNLHPERTLVVEDTMKGLLAARSAGARCIIIHSPRLPFLDYSIADAVFSNLSEFVKAYF
jgi:beta-phosphoglucomutase-like phosphatase (HAD superfamily)